MYDDELYHFGIIGMKWGVRRFREKDGSLTEAGKKRYSNKESSNEKADSTTTGKSNSSETKKNGVAGKIVAAGAIASVAALAAAKSKNLSSLNIDEQMKQRALEPSVKGGKDKPPMSRVENVAKQTGNFATNAAKASNAIYDIKKAMQVDLSKLDLSSMSNDELKERSNRLRMEQEYIRLLSNPPVVSRGQRITEDVLTIGESLAGIGVAGLIGYRMIQEIKGK